MARPITLFSGYTQKENRVTNYCLLVLKMLYEENPKYLGEVLSSLIGEDVADRIGVSFRHQERRDSSIPDGLIIQDAIAVYIETKNFDWFYDQQLENHLASLGNAGPGLKVLLALGKFDSTADNRFESIRALCKTEYQETIVFAQITFEDLLQSLRIDGLPKNLADAVSDLEAFFNEEDLLPSWQRWLDVVNCAGIPEDVTEARAYLCPTKGGAYTHARCKYFGMYREKRVEVVAPIEAVVDVDLEGGSELKWTNVEAPADSLVQRAIRTVQERRPSRDGATRVFLLGDLQETDFRKDSPGGMLGSKLYFDFTRLEPRDAKDLAEKLRGRMWSELR